MIGIKRIFFISLKHNPSFVPSKLIINNFEITEVTGIANEFNTYFANIGNRLANEFHLHMYHLQAIFLLFPKQSVFFSFLLAPQRLRKKSLT